MAVARYVIVGAGFAGAATAYYLARGGAKGVVVLEQEETAGVHSSGRNASMVRQVVSDPELAPLTFQGAAFLRGLPAGWPVPVDFRQNGSLLLASGEGWRKLRQDADMASRAGIEAECWSPEKAKERVPALEGANFDGAVWCPTDGVVDVHALLTGYIRAAQARGVEIRYRSPVRAVEVRDGRVRGVITDGELVRTETVIDAAGAWANTIAKMAGALDAPLRPCRRHLFLSSPLPWVDPGWPFVWDLTHDLYFRPESGGLLLCACDQEEIPPSGIPPTDESVAELLAEKVRLYLPAIFAVSIAKTWAGFRTLSPDGRFVIGWDPKIEGFFWVAGLGGHGVTTSSSVGALAARLLLGKEAEARAFSPTRFVR